MPGRRGSPSCERKGSVGVGRRSVVERLAGVAVAAVAAATLSGCAGDAVAAEPTGAVAFVVGGHANMPAAELTGAAASARDMAVAQQSFFSVVVADGAPYVAASDVLEAPGDTAAAQEEQRAANRERVDGAVEDAQARTAETDLLAALEVAATSIRDQPGHRSIIVLDSGLSTVGALDFRRPGLMDAVPSEVADTLGEDTRELPNLTGMSVRFMGLGATAEPQEELDRVRLAQLRAMWTTLAETAGAVSVSVEPTVPAGEAGTGLPPVSPVPLPPGYACDGTTMTITGGKLAYRPYTDNWIDEETAEAVLRPIADQVREGLMTATLRGTVADIRDPAEQMMLSYLQAQAVADLWLEYGVPVQQLTVIGLGSDHPGHRPEWSADRVLDPVVAALNRTVTITFSSPVTC